MLASLKDFNVNNDCIKSTQIPQITQIFANKICKNRMLFVEFQFDKIALICAFLFASFAFKKTFETAS